MTTSANPVTSGWPTGSEFEESNITDTDSLCEVIEESMDMEMAWQTHTLMITSDREKVRARSSRQGAGLCCRRSCEASPRMASRGGSGHCQMPSDTKNMGGPALNATVPPKRKTSRDPMRGVSRVWCHTLRKRMQPVPQIQNQISSTRPSPGRRCLGSRSFTPFGHLSHRRPRSHSRHHSHSQSSTPGQSHCRDSTPHTSRKRPVAKTPRLMEATPMQSPAQKTPKLKSLVQRVPTTKNYHATPHTIVLTRTPRNSSSLL